MRAGRYGQGSGTDSKAGQMAGAHAGFPKGLASVRSAAVGLLASAALAALAAVATPPAASAAGPSPLGLSCTARDDGTRFCPGDGTTQRIPSWDGTPLDVDVTLPPAGNGPFPTIVMLHGWGNDKTGFESTNPAGNGYNAGAGTYAPVTYHYNNDYYARQGYAVVTYSARGKGASCGGGGAPQAQLQQGACANGFIRLADQRYEVRDTQYLLGLLVDQGIAKAGALGVTGISYGGGESLTLAYLKNRIRCAGEPSAPGDPCNGRPADALIPWTSPAGTPLSITAAHPRWFWSDLVSALLPNGRILDFDTSTGAMSRSPMGVEIQSFVSGLFATGDKSGYYVMPQPPGGANSAWDLTSDFAVWNAGEPYGSQAQAIADEVYGFHQAFGIPNSSPSPLLLESGWNDDLFPPAQALRTYNDLRAQNPNADVSLLFGDVGHARGSNKPTVNSAFNEIASGFFDAHLKGLGVAPPPGSVTAFTTTCPSPITGALDGGPYSAPSWRAIHPGAILFGSNAAQTVMSNGGNPQTSAAFDPVAQMPSDGCKTATASTDPGTASYTTPSLGFTMLGLPTIAATIATTGTGGQLDARLWDVSPEGTQLLVTRGGYRLLDNQSGPITFQLHGNAYRFAAGHTAKLELLGRDAPYYRASNGSFSLSVQNLVVELPVAANPGATPQIVAPPNLSRLATARRVVCVSKRVIRVPLPRGRGIRVLSATLLANGRPTHVFRGRALRARSVVLRRLPAGTIRVRIRYRITRRGHSHVATRTRTYHTCVAARPAKPPRRKPAKPLKRRRGARG